MLSAWGAVLCFDDMVNHCSSYEGQAPVFPAPLPEVLGTNTTRFGFTRMPAYATPVTTTLIITAAVVSYRRGLL